MCRDIVWADGVRWVRLCGLDHQDTDSRSAPHTGRHGKECTVPLAGVSHSPTYRIAAADGLPDAPCAACRPAVAKKKLSGQEEALAASAKPARPPSPESSDSEVGPTRSSTAPGCLCARHCPALLRHSDRCVCVCIALRCAATLKAYSTAEPLRYSAVP